MTTIRRTPRERATRLGSYAAVATLAGIVVAALSPLFGAAALAVSILACALFVTAILVGAVAINLTTRRTELVWIVAGLLVYWVANTVLYLHLIVAANNTLDDVPSQQVIDLLSTLFVAGSVALGAAVLISLIGWAVRPGRWNALNGPGGQS